MLRFFRQLWPHSRGEYRRLPTLVLINGLAEQGESWYRSREVWQKHFDVQVPGILVYDGPVLQERLRSGQRITVDFLTDRLTAFLDQFVQSPPYHLVASSLGGQIAVEYAYRHPDMVGRLALLCPSGFGGIEKLPVTEGARNNNSQGLVESVFHDPRYAIPPVVQYFERKFQSRAWRKAMFQTIRGTKQHSVIAKLPMLSRPTLVICGEEDRIVDPHSVRREVEHLPNFEFVMLPRCGHAPQLEQPHVVNRLVLDFLRKEPPRTAEPVAANDADEQDEAASQDVQATNKPQKLNREFTKRDPAHY
jgi:pimeloyl-ACP methyl ester carboxylesterase